MNERTHLKALFLASTTDGLLSRGYPIDEVVEKAKELTEQMLDEVFPRDSNSSGWEVGGRQ